VSPISSAGDENEVEWMFSQNVVPPSVRCSVSGSREPSGPPSILLFDLDVPDEKLFAAPLEDDDEVVRIPQKIREL
jgi:hypothetical protein